MTENQKKFAPIFEQFLKQEKKIELFKELSSGENSIIRDIKYEGKPYVGKLTEKIEHDKSSFESYKKLKGPNIIKINKVFEIYYDKKIYNLIIMEKAGLRDLGKMCDHLRENNYKSINKPFSEVIGNNLLKFFIKQLAKILDTLDRNELVHYDIKPQNLLITSGLKIKISDFSFLINLKDEKNNKIKLPSQTRSYVSPEYFKDQTIKLEDVKKQDYFALGASLFYLKLGEQMLTFKDSNEQLSEDRLIDLLQRDIANIRSFPLFNNDFVDFICDLIHYVPEERINLEEIYRNKWLNENFDDILFIAHAFLKEEEDKLMKELEKSDFILDKQKDINTNQKNRKNFTFVE